MRKTLGLRIGLVLLGVALLIPVLAFAAPPPPPPHHQNQPPQHQPNFVRGAFVNIEMGRFAPATVTIHPGEKVTWTNHTRRPQQIIFRGMSSPVMGRNAQWSRVFRAPGEFPYYLASNRMIRGKVIVRFMK